MNHTMFVSGLRVSEIWERFMPIATINPATEVTEKTFDALSDSEVDRLLQRSADAFERFRRTSFEERAGCMMTVVGILQRDKDDTARLLTTEMGKTITAARAEVDKCAGGARFYAEHGAALLADEPADATAV